jgi:colicin import membrane protein
MSGKGEFVGVLIWLLAVLCLGQSALAQAPKPAPPPISAAEVAQLTGVISSCLKRTWRIPSKGPAVRVTLRWRLERDGKLSGQPEVLNPQRDPAFAASARSAVRAVRACEPFRLPADRHDVWKRITWEFDPTSLSN